MKKGKIIFLNGVSSAGKTTLAKVLQSRLTEPFYLISRDAFCEMEPKKFLEIDLDKTRGTALTGLHHTIKTLSYLGINVIVDHVLLKEQGAAYNITGLNNMEECVSLLHGHDVLFVLVVCPLDEQRRREQLRGDRRIGQGESQLPRLCPQDIYDITVDTFHESIEACADRIIERLDCPEKHTAFQMLLSQIQQ